MKRENINSNLTAIAFEFFYSFSRFEFCLKENGYLRTEALLKASLNVLDQLAELSTLQADYHRHY
jgi:hypothetical protein